LRDRLSFLRFVGLAPHEAGPDAKTIWLYREQLTRAGALARLFARFDAVPDRGNTGSGANVALLQRRGLSPQFRRAKPRGRPMPGAGRSR
jgi:IS5 family transposase